MQASQSVLKLLCMPAVLSSTGMASTARAWMLCGQTYCRTGEASCNGQSTSLEASQALWAST